MNSPQLSATWHQALSRRLLHVQKLLIDARRIAAVFETPLDLPQPVGMAVTIEQEGGVPSPTGDKYLAGLKCGRPRGVIEQWGNEANPRWSETQPR
jgi:hypothetical protein